MRKGRRTLAVALSLLLGGAAGIIPASADDEHPSLPLTLRGIKVSGPLWYSASFVVPSNKQIRISWSSTLSRDWRSAACFKFSHYADSSTQGNDSGWTMATPNTFSNQPSGTYLTAEATPDSLGAHSLAPADVPNSDLGTLTLIRQGSDTPSSGLYTGQRIGFSGGYFNPEKSGRQDVAFFCASSDPILATSMTLTADKGVRLLSESWGTSGIALDTAEDFTGGAVVRTGTANAVMPGGIDSMAMVEQTKNVRFRRRALAFFRAGYVFTPAYASYPPALLSIIGPGPTRSAINSGRVHNDVPVEFPGSQDWHADINDLRLIGDPPGTYQFRVEAFAGAFTFPAVTPVGVIPFVMLGRADADFPACTVLRVRTKAADGHPVCY